MKTLDRKEINSINVCRANVAVTNGDPFAVESPEHYNYISEALADANEVVVLTDTDDDFEDWAQRLDYTDAMPAEIYVVDSNRLAFTLG